jgi:hypothetical protein
LLITKSFIHEVSKHGASLLLTLYPEGIKEKRKEKKLNPWLCVWEQAGSGAFPYTFRGQNEKGQKQ